MRFRSIQAGPLMQMPVFILLFLAPVVRAARPARPARCTRSRALNPITYVLEAGAKPHLRASPSAGRARRSASPQRSPVALRDVWAFRGLRSGGSRRLAARKSRRDPSLRWPRRVAATWPGRAVPTRPDVGRAAERTSRSSPRTPSGVELCLFDDENARGAASRSAERTAHNWHVLRARRRAGAALRLPGARALGARAAAIASIPHKLLIDPYAKAVEGPDRLRTAARTLAYAAGDEDVPRRATDSAAAIPKAVVERDDFDWEDDRLPATPWSDTLIYELHVKGFTRRHPTAGGDPRDVPRARAPAVLTYLRELG